MPFRKIPHCFISLLIFCVFFLLPNLPGASGISSGSRSTEGAIEKDLPEKRLITMSPAITEIVFALGAGQDVVGVSDFCSFPPEALAKEKVGGMIDLNIEKISALRPTCIIIQGVNQKLTDYCGLRKIPFFRVTLDTMEDVPVAIRLIGEKTGRMAEADALVAGIKERITHARDAVKGRKRPKVFISLNHVPGSLNRLTTIGPGTFLQDAVEVAGGENIFSDMKILYPMVSKESLLKRGPDIIVEVLYDLSLGEKNRRRLLDDWKLLPGIPAVREDRVVILDQDYVLIPGPRIYLLVEKLAGIFHPEVQRIHE